MTKRSSQAKARRLKAKITAKSKFASTGTRLSLVPDKEPPMVRVDLLEGETVKAYSIAYLGDLDSTINELKKKYLNLRKDTPGIITSAAPTSEKESCLSLP